MTDTTLDHPDVAVFPPVIPLATLAAAGLLQWLAPLGWIADLDGALRIGVGAIVVISGLVTASAAMRALLRHGTNVDPSQPTTMLVTDGVFGLCRNPLYVGVLMALCGLSLLFDLDWVLLLIVPSSLLMHLAVVRREEAYLERKFGEAYRRYKERVPRYLFSV